MLKIAFRNHFKKDIKRLKRRRKAMSKIKDVIEMLVHNHPLPEKYRDHALVGRFAYHREYHIEPDWLLIYKKDDKTLILERTGSHADLFR